MKKQLLCLGMMLTLGLLPGTSVGLQTAQAAPKSIKVASSAYPGTPIYRAWQEAQAFIEERGKGKYRLDVYDSYKLGTTQTSFQGVQFGTIHITHDGSPNMTAFDPALSLFDLPYLFPDYESADAILSGPVGKQILASLSKKGGVTALGFIGNGFRGLFTRESITGLADAKGKKIRATPSKVHIAGLKAMGFAATPMAWAEVVTGVQQGVISGFDIDLASANTMGLGEIAPYVLLSAHMYSPHPIVVSTDWWESLGEDRPLFEEMIQLVTRRGTELVREDNLKALEVLPQAGHKLVPLAPEARAVWIAATANLYKDFPQIPAALVEAIQAELERMGKRQ